jgi:predicted phage terminase large subunit-like protein
MSATRAAHKLLAQRLLSKRDLLYFIQKTHPDYQPGWVHQDICWRLERFSQAVREKKSPRLMLLCPPRSGKSEIASVRFPAWHLGHCPNHEVINVGYNMDLPMKFSKQVRALVREASYNKIFPGTELDPDSQSVEAWNTKAGGVFQAAGVGGGLTGKGGHILIIDDPLKNMEEADSADRRDLIQDWYESTAYTRLSPGGGVLLIMTRWSDDDLAGRLLARELSDPLADKFEVVSYPALAEAYEWRHRHSLSITRTSVPALSATVEDADQFELVRRPGEALHPERYPVDALQRIKANMHPRVWSALYQQNPVPDEGMYFQDEWLRYLPSWPTLDHGRIFCAWDFAIGEKQTSDWTAGVVLLQDPSDTLYVLDVVRFKGDSFTIVEAVLNLYERWGKIPKTDFKLGFEDGPLFRAIEPLLKKRMAERKLYPSYETMRPITDKSARARPLQGRLQQGRVVMLQNNNWHEALRHEMLRFPAGTHDDMCVTGDTRIRMGDHTLRPITVVGVGDMVWTPNGPKKVVAAACTHKRAYVTELYTRSHRHRLKGTASHPVWCVNKAAYVPMGLLEIGDLVLLYRVPTPVAVYKIERRAKPVSVYNLTVEDEHAYYANDILTHNCDALSWAVNMCVDKPPPRAPEAKKGESWRDRLERGTVGGGFMSA